MAVLLYEYCSRFDCSLSSIEVWRFYATRNLVSHPFGLNNCYQFWPKTLFNCYNHICRKAFFGWCVCSWHSSVRKMHTCFIELFVFIILLYIDNFVFVHWSVFPHPSVPLLCLGESHSLLEHSLFISFLLFSSREFFCVRASVSDFCEYDFVDVTFLMLLVCWNWFSVLDCFILFSSWSRSASTCPVTSTLTQYFKALFLLL